MDTHVPIAGGIVTGGMPMTPVSLNCITWSIMRQAVKIRLKI
jgi:hypothetical protein